jgi:tRNA A22 N-methylase
MKISKRNQFYINLALSDYDFWDVACDHGQAGFFAFQSKKFKNIYFVDPVEKILEHTKMAIKKSLNELDEFDERMFFRCMEGQDLKETVKGNVLIAGVGGELIKQIILSLLEKNLLKAERLIFSPYSDLIKIEQLQSNHSFHTEYNLIQETSFVENKKERKIYIFDRINISSSATK